MVSPTGPAVARSRGTTRSCGVRLRSASSSLSMSAESGYPSTAHAPARAPAPRRVRLFVFSPWAGPLQDGAGYLCDLPACDVARQVSNPADAALVQMARLDCDWHGENVRALGSASANTIEFLPVQAVGKPGLADLLEATRPADEEWWLVLTGQHPQMMAGMIGRVLGILAGKGVRTLYY